MKLPFMRERAAMRPPRAATSLFDQTFNLAPGDIVRLRQLKDGLVTDEWSYAATKVEGIRIRVDTDNKEAQPMRKTR